MRGSALLSCHCLHCAREQHALPSDPLTLPGVMRPFCSASLIMLYAILPGRREEMERLKPWPWIVRACGSRLKCVLEPFTQSCSEDTLQPLDSPLVFMDPGCCVSSNRLRS